MQVAIVRHTKNLFFGCYSSIVMSWRCFDSSHRASSSFSVSLSTYCIGLSVLDGSCLLFFHPCSPTDSFVMKRNFIFNPDWPGVIC